MIAAAGSGSGGVDGGPDGGRAHGEPVDIVTIGNAMVDVLAHSEDGFLDRHRLVKGSMELVEADRALHLYDDMVHHAGARQETLLQMSGGSAANTAVVVACMGGRAGFIGKVRDDDLGRVFTHDLRAAGVAYATPWANDHVPTGRCLVNVTPDAERTMCTFLGAARGLRVPDMDTALLAGAQVTYLEGYLWDELRVRDALDRAVEVVHGAGRRFSLSLSDPFCVDRFRHEWIDLIAGGVDILFGNDLELCSLFEATDLDEAVERVRDMVEIAAVTRGAKGSLVVTADEVVEVEAFPVTHVVDSTGAGDAYAGGFLYGFSQGFDLTRCAELGGLAAAEVISHMGARPGPGLASLAAALHTADR